jgi:hypothetical protein
MLCGMDSAHRPQRYLVVVKGRLSEQFASAFDGVELATAPGRTVLSGTFVDQAQLYGLLDRLRDFGIELVSVNALEEERA